MSHRGNADRERFRRFDGSKIYGMTSSKQDGLPVLEGIRVLDLSRVMSGPYCTAMLADLGAEVIKIEMPGRGDEARGFGPFKDGESTYFMLLNRGKKSVTIDLKSDHGVALLKTLVGQCDVLVENFRPGVMQRLGLDYQTVREINPRLVYASISGFGQDGPFADYPALDLVIQAMSGLMSLTGPREGPRTAVGESLGDVCTGMFAAWGIMAALFDRERTGSGRHLDVPMLDSVFSMLLTGLSQKLFFGTDPQPVGNRHPITYPVDSFPVADGEIVLVAFSDAIFAQLTKAIGRPELATDTRFADNAARSANDVALHDLISQWTATRPAAEVVEVLGKAGVPCAPVWSLGQLLESAHGQTPGLVREGIHRTFGRVPTVQQPVRFSHAPQPQSQNIPTLGEHTDDVLGDVLGLDAAAIADLRKRGALG